MFKSTIYLQWTILTIISKFIQCFIEWYYFFHIICIRIAIPCWVCWIAFEMLKRSFYSILNMKQFNRWFFENELLIYRPEIEYLKSCKSSHDLILVCAFTYVACLPISVLCFCKAFFLVILMATAVFPHCGSNVLWITLYFPNINALVKWIHSTCHVSKLPKDWYFN